MSAGVRGAGEYDGLVAAVTGGGAGIGAAIVTELRSRGARVAALDLDPFSAPDGALPVVCDVTDRASVAAAVAEVAAEFRGLDVLVNNAGISAIGTVEVWPNGSPGWLRHVSRNLPDPQPGSRTQPPVGALVAGGDRQNLFLQRVAAHGLRHRFGRTARPLPCNTPSPCGRSCLPGVVRRNPGRSNGRRAARAR